MSGKGIKRKALSVDEKIKILKDVDENSNLSRVQLAKKLKLPVSTLNGIVAKRNVILNSSGPCQKNKKLKKGKYEDIEKKLVMWFKQFRSANIPINGTILKEKADEIAKTLNIEFTPSNGWIDRLKKRAGLRYKTIKGESKSVDQQEAEEWRRSLPDLISGYQPKDIFNMDECGLFFNLLPDKTYTYAGENCHGGKGSKERLTILVGANMDGTEKLPILVIGKSKKPRCFRNVKSLPCLYESNKKAWMTIKMYESYLTRLDAKMKREKRNILIFLDNCAAHSKVTKFHNIEVHFLPPNSTSVLQPMDQGVIKVFKQHYKKRLVKHMLEKFENTGEMKKINVLESIHFIISAWELISPTIIANCFRRAGFLDEESTEEYLLNVEAGLSDGDSREDNADWIRLQKRMNFTASFEEYISVDDDILPCELLTINDICEVTESNGQETSDTEEDEDELIVPSFSDATKGLDTFRRFIESVENVPEQVFKNLRQLEWFQQQIAENNRKQKTLHDFFHKIN